MSFGDSVLQKARPQSWYKRCNFVLASSATQHHCSDHSGADTSVPSPCQETRLLHLSDKRGTPIQPWLTTRSDVLLLLPTLRTHRTGPCAPDQSDLCQDIWLRVCVKSDFHHLQSQNSAISRCSTAVSASPSNIEHTNGPLAFSVSVVIVIIFDRHHVFHRFRSHPFAPAPLNRLQPQAAFDVTITCTDHLFSDTCLRRLRSQIWAQAVLNSSTA